MEMKKWFPVFLGTWLAPVCESFLHRNCPKQKYFEEDENNARLQTGLSEQRILRVP